MFRKKNPVAENGAVWDRFEPRTENEKIKIQKN